MLEAPFPQGACASIGFVDIPNIAPACGLHQSRYDDTTEDMQNILLDDSCGHESIQSEYHPEEVLGGLEVGTCATVIMDLQQHRFYARKGPGTTRNFQCFE